MERELGADVFSATTGKPVRGQWSLTKHQWLVDHPAAVGAAVRRFNVAEWVARGLGGGAATLAARAAGHLDAGKVLGIRREAGS